MTIQEKLDRALYLWKKVWETLRKEDINTDDAMNAFTLAVSDLVAYQTKDSTQEEYERLLNDVMTTMKSNVENYCKVVREKES
jgi:hypothetical protein